MSIYRVVGMKYETKGLTTDALETWLLVNVGVANRLPDGTMRCGIHPHGPFYTWAPPELLGREGGRLRIAIAGENLDNLERAWDAVDKYAGQLAQMLACDLDLEAHDLYEWDEKEHGIVCRYDAMLPVGHTAERTIAPHPGGFAGRKVGHA